MHLIDFTKDFPCEEACERKSKEYRVREGVVCPKCGCAHHYRKSDKKCFECKGCPYRQSLTANTVMHGSRLPLLHWFTTMHLLASTKKEHKHMAVKYIKMIAIDNLESTAIDTKVKENIESSSTADTLAMLSSTGSLLPD